MTDRPTAPPSASKVHHDRLAEAAERQADALENIAGVLTRMETPLGLTVLVVSR